MRMMCGQIGPLQVLGEYGRKRRQSFFLSIYLSRGARRRSTRGAANSKLPAGRYVHNIRIRAARRSSSKIEVETRLAEAIVFSDRF
jgi:hypothetical protein